MSAQRLTTDPRTDRRTADRATTPAARPPTARVPFTFDHTDRRRLLNLIEDGNSIVSIVDPAAYEDV